MGKCNTTKEELNTIIQNDNEKDEHLDLGLKAFENEAETSGKPVSSILENDFNLGIIDEDIITVNKRFIKKYGTDSERLFWAQYLRGLIEKNQIISPIIEELAFLVIGRGVKVGGKLLDVKDKKIYNKKGQIILSRLSVPALKYLIGEAQQLGYNTGKGILSVANFNGYIARKLTPERRGRREPSLGYLMFARKAMRLAPNIASRMVPFTSKTVSSNAVGMSEILYKVKLLSAGIRGQNLGEKLIGMFSRYNHGWVYIDPKTNEFMIYEHYGPYKEENKLGHNVWVTWPDGSLRHKWQNPVKLRNYTPPNKNKGDWYVDLPQSKIEQFKDLSVKAQEINVKLFDEFIKEFKSSTNILIESLMKATNYEIEENILRAYILRGKDKIPIIKGGIPVDFIDILEAPGMTKDNVELLKELKEVFAFSINDEMIIANGGKLDFDEIRRKTRYWPVLYDRFRFEDILDRALVELTEKIDVHELFLKGGVWENGDPITDEEKIHGEKFIKDMEAKLRHGNIVSGKLPEMGEHVDGSSDIPFGYAADNKYFKSISGMYDVRQMRVTEGAYTDMVKSGMAQIERNLLAAQLVDSMIMSRNVNLKENNNPKLHKAVKDAIINLYKILYNSTDTRGPFGITTDKLNSTLNFLRPGRNKTPEQTANTMRIVRQWLAGWYLSGFSTVLQNKADQFRNIIEFGIDRYWDAGEVWKTGSISRKGAEKIIEIAGILTFDEFFSVSMVNDITHIDAELKTTFGVQKAMIRFHLNRKKMKESKAREIFEKEIQKYLDASTAVTKAEEFVIKDKEELKTSRYDLKQQRRLMRTAKLVEYAIRKEFVFTDLNKQANKDGFSWKVFLLSPPQQAMKIISDFWRNSGWTMSKTEQDIRALTFIIGANMKEENLGLLEGQGIHWWQLDEGRTKKALNKDGKFVDRKLTDEEKKNERYLIREIIRAGMTYEKYVNFGLSSQFVGEQYAGDFGKWMSIFKVWQTQKFGSDVRKILDAYLEQKGDKKVLKGEFDPISIIKMIRKTITPQGKDLRTTDPKLAAFKSWFWIQGSLTILWDLAMVQALPAFSMYKLYRIGTGFKSSRGFTSDLISLSVLPLMLLLKFGLALGEDDDEGPEDLSDILAYYTRKGTFGFVPQWSFEVLLSLMDALLGNSKEASQRAVNVLGPATGGSTEVGKAIKVPVKAYFDWLED